MSSEYHYTELIVQYAHLSTDNFTYEVEFGDFLVENYPGLKLCEIKNPVKFFNHSQYNYNNILDIIVELR